MKNKSKEIEGKLKIIIMQYLKSKIIVAKTNTVSDNSDEEEADNEVSDGHSVEENDSSEIFNSGWADSISQILKSNKPKRKKCLVLSRAKKLTAVKKKESKSVECGFQIQQKDGEITEEKIEAKIEKNLEEIPKKRVINYFLG